MKKEDSSINFLAAFFGFLLTVSGLILVIINNITTAVGTIGLTDGEVVIPDNFWFQFPDVLDSGRFGMLFAIVVALVANSFQFVAIILRDKSLVRENPTYATWILIFDIASRIFDIGTATWYISHDYVYFKDSSLESIFYGVFIAVFHFVFVILFLTVGSEVFFAYGLRILGKYGFSGGLAFIDFLLAFKRFWREIEIKLNGNQESYGNYRNQEERRPPGRPTKYKELDTGIPYQ